MIEIIGILTLMLLVGSIGTYFVILAFMYAIWHDSSTAIVVGIISTISLLYLEYLIIINNFTITVT